MGSGVREGQVRMAIGRFVEENAMSLVAAMAVEDLAQTCGVDETTMLGHFLSSKTASQLFNPDLKLWWDGPAYVADAYRAEVGAGDDAWASSNP